MFTTENELYSEKTLNRLYSSIYLLTRKVYSFVVCLLNIIYLSVRNQMKSIRLIFSLFVTEFRNNYHFIFIVKCVFKIFVVLNSDHSVRSYRRLLLIVLRERSTSGVTLKKPSLTDWKLTNWNNVFVRIKCDFSR